MRTKIIIIILSILLSLFQSSLNFGVLNLSLPLIFFIYLLFFHNPDDSLFSAFVSGIIMDLFAMNFGTYLFSFLLIFIILYYIEKEFLPNDRFSTYVWMNFIGTILMFIFFIVYNFIISGLDLGIYELNFFRYIIMLLEAIIFNILLACVLYFLTYAFSKKAKNKFISIG